MHALDRGRGIAFFGSIAIVAACSVQPAPHFASSAKVIEKGSCCENVLCREEPGECSCKACNDDSSCSSGTCRVLPAPFGGYCVEPAPSGPCVAIEELRIDTQSWCVFEMTRSVCTRRTELMADGGIVAQIIRETPSGLRIETPVSFFLGQQELRAVQPLSAHAGCERIPEGTVCLSSQPYIVVTERQDGGRRLFAFDLGGTARPSREVEAALSALNRVAAPVWVDAGLGFHW